MMTLLGRVALLLSVAVLAACGQASSAPQDVDALLLRHRGGVAILEPGAKTPTVSAAQAVPSLNWSALVQARVSGRTTTLSAVDARTEDELWSRTIDGRFRTKIVSADGQRAIASPRAQPYYGFGRRRTQMTVVGNGIRSARHIELFGNYEPEAFSTDGESVFVIKYMPAHNPKRYQVRRLDIATGSVHGVYTPHAELQRSMGGTARIQASSPDGSRLYTLYTVGDKDDKRAFVHVLDLDREWAHCIDLPGDFARATRRSTAINVSPDGKKAYVADTSTGVLAEVDAVTLQVERVATFGAMVGKAFVTAASDGSVYVAGDHTVAAFDSDLADRWSSRFSTRIVGLQTAADARKVYVASPTTLQEVEAGSGDVSSTVKPPGISRITSLGPILRLEVPPPLLKCAC